LYSDHISIVFFVALIKTFFLMHTWKERFGWSI